MTHSILLRGREFIFDGERWYNKKTFQAPTPSELVSLGMMLEKETDFSMRTAPKKSKSPKKTKADSSELLSASA